MQREIKFRGKRIDNGEWEYGHYVVLREGHMIVNTDGAGLYFYNQVDPATVGQFAGMKDQNGREIYEGDILRFTHEREDFINTDARIAVEIPKIYYMIDNPYNHSFEVIGNIYENPELLKEGKEHV